MGVSIASGVSAIDTLSDTTSASGWTDTIFGRILYVASGGQIDVALRNCINDLRTTALNTQGKVKPIIIKGDSYTLGSQGSLDSMVILEPFVELKFVGTTFIDCAGKTIPIFWIRNDVTPSITYGPESDANNHKLISGSSLILSCASNPWVSGSCAIRWGNGDGIWGTNFTGDNKYYTAFMEIENLHMQFFDHSIELTNNGSFCSRWTNVWSSNPNWSIVTSSSSAEKDAYEMHSFIRFFSSNTNLGHIQCNSTGNRDHQLSFLHSSLTYTAGTVVQINTAAQCRIEITSSRLENFLKATDALVTSSRSWVRLTNVTLIPSNSLGGATEVATVRPIFRGLTHRVSLTDCQWNLTSVIPWNTDTYNDASRQFISDDPVIVSLINSFCDDPIGTITSNNSMRIHPINKRQILNRNWDFEESTLLGWTTGGTGTITLSSTVNDFYSGTKGVKIVNSAQYSNLTSDIFPVTPGKFLFGNAIMRYADTSTDTLPNVTFEVIFYHSDGTSVLSNSVLSSPVTQHNWSNRKSATRFLQSGLGTGLVTVPPTAKYAALKIHWHGNGPVTTTTTGTFCVDNATIVEL